MPRRVRALDGIRGMAITVVLVGHIFRSRPESTSEPWRWLMIPFRNPDLGVQIFFVLSGFLITGILLRERDRTGAVSLRDFYVRRALRIWPAFYVFLAVATALALVGVLAIDTADTVSAALFAWNYSPTARSPWLEHTWSLSVEEQFYLLWPLLLVRLSARRAVHVATTAILVSPIIRVVTYFLVPDGRISGYFHTRADLLLAGCLLALLPVAYPALEERLREVTRRPATPILAVAFLVLAPYGTELAGGMWTITVMWTITAVAIGAVLLLATDPRPSRIKSALGWQPLVALGLISFSVYLWQQLFTIAEVSPWLRFPPIAVMCSVLAGWLSYRIVERPFLTMKDRIGQKAAVTSEQPPQSARDCGPNPNDRGKL